MLRMRRNTQQDQTCQREKKKTRGRTTRCHLRKFWRKRTPKLPANGYVSGEQARSQSRPGSLNEPRWCRCVSYLYDTFRNGLFAAPPTGALYVQL